MVSDIKARKDTCLPTHYAATHSPTYYAFSIQGKAITFCTCACVLNRTILCKFIEVFCVGSKVTTWLPLKTCLGLQIAIVNNLLREERKLRVFENMVLSSIFGPTRDEVTGEWRRLHNE